MPYAASHVFRAAIFTLTILCFHVASAVALEPTAQGLHDLVVLDPGAHERGLPAVKLDPAEDGRLTIDIPPAVHVHRYYYSGDKEIQGPIIHGGPTVVVANHPKTGERMYVDVTLPAGAPRIAYNKHGITYVYPDKRVEVMFQGLASNPHRTIVRQKSGKGFRRNVRNARQHLKKHVRESLDNSPMVQSVTETGGEASDFVHGFKVALGDLSTQGGDALRTLSNMVPGVVYIKSLAEQEPQKDYDSLIRQAGIKKARRETPFLPTNR